MHQPSSQRFGSVYTALRKARPRLLTLLVIAVVLFGTNAQTAVAFAAAVSVPDQAGTANTSASKDPHKTSAAPSVGKINTAPPPAPRPLTDGLTATPAGANPLSSGGDKSVSPLAQAGKINEPVMPAAPQGKPKITPHELTEDRTATSTKYLNQDGSITQTTYFSPQFYQTNGSWQKIDNTLVEDDNAADSGNIFGKALGKAESLVSAPDAFKTQANSWQARFADSDFDGGMVRIQQGSDQVGFSPVGANPVTPVVTTDKSGQQTVTYNNLWSGVDVTYQVDSDKVKESISLQNKDAAARVQFTMIGASLQKPSTSSKPGNAGPAFVIHGALGDKFGVMPVNLLLNHFGYVDSKASGLSQTVSGNTLTVGVDSSYLQSLPATAFPVVIDPTITNTFTSSFGSTGVGSYMSFESNGTTCGPSTCDLYAGGFYDSSHNWQDWRGALFAPYTVLEGQTLTNANLHLAGINLASTATWNYQAAPATCITGYSCMGTVSGSSDLPNATGGINVTSIYQNYMSNGNYTGWLMVDGDGGPGALSLADFNPDSSYVTFTYTTQLAAPTFVTPQSGQVFTDPQASFKINTESNPNDSTPLLYQFRISDNPDGTGLVLDSGENYNTAWTVPDGTLQNGSTYYAQAQSYDQSTGVTSGWSAARSFTIDMREGQDKTQTYDTVGPAKVDLVTGNLQTGNASHTTTALGGDMGVGLSYSSPIKSSEGLVGSYWNLPSGGSGIPTTTPDLQRVDQNVDFDWQSGSPGSHINSTYFAAQWNGYLVAPASASYTFGGLNDDSLSIKVNGTTVYNNSYCPSGPCYGSSLPDRR